MLNKITDVFGFLMAALMIVCLCIVLVGLIHQDRRPTVAHDYAGRDCVAAPSGGLMLRNRYACIIPDCPDGGFGCGDGA